MHSIRHMKTIEFKTFDTSEDNIRTSSAFNYLNSNTENKSYNDLDQYVMTVSYTHLTLPTNREV